MAHLVLFINLGNIKSVANHKISTHFPLFCDFQVTCHALYDVMWPLCLSIAKIGEKNDQLPILWCFLQLGLCSWF